MFGPVFESASGQHEDITFGEIDTEDQQGLAAAAQILSIPTLMAFRDGVLVFSQARALPAASLEKLIQAVRDLDMDRSATISRHSRRPEPLVRRPGAISLRAGRNTSLLSGRRDCEPKSYCRG